ncbi:hypothetical protein BC827DRAFT_1203635 [Russula dissimulans]|nr:hypothetical protein BC827DRAFT_1203635 [Russula dissimulans]
MQAMPTTPDTWLDVRLDGFRALSCTLVVSFGYFLYDHKDIDTKSSLAGNGGRQGGCRMRCTECNGKAVRDCRNLLITWRPLRPLIHDLVPLRRDLENMAGIEQLIVHIYHEKQERGSALCAQHALNSLLRVSL